MRRPIDRGALLCQRDLGGTDNRVIRLVDDPTGSQSLQKGVAGCPGAILARALSMVNSRVVRSRFGSNKRAPIDCADPLRPVSED